MHVHTKTNTYTKKKEKAGAIKEAPAAKADPRALRDKASLLSAQYMFC